MSERDKLWERLDAEATELSHAAIAFIERLESELAEAKGKANARLAALEITKGLLKEQSAELAAEREKVERLEGLGRESENAGSEKD